MSTENIEKEVVFEDGDTKTVLMDSISYVTDDNRGDILVSGSHGGTSSAGYAVSVKAAAVFFNDAAVSKSEAPVAGLHFDYAMLLHEMGDRSQAAAHLQQAEIGYRRDLNQNAIKTMLRFNKPDEAQKLKNHLAKLQAANTRSGSGPASTI